MATELMVHATRRPTVRDQLVALLFPPGPPGRHPLAPPGSGLGELPYERADAILKSLDIGMRPLTLPAPEQRPPELFRTALGLLTAPQVSRDSEA